MLSSCPSFFMKKLLELSDNQLCDLVDNRWKSSDAVWDTLNTVTKENLAIYKNEPKWLQSVPIKKSKVRANRIFRNTESVINSLIANPPKPIIMPGKETPQSKELAILQEKYFIRRYEVLNVKEVLRKGLRNLYFSRLIVLKPYWDSNINDFNVRSIDPKKIRVGKYATKEDNSEFAIEEVTDNLISVLRRFPKKQKELLEKAGYESGEGDAIPDRVFVDNPEITYQEAWVRDAVIFKYDRIILGKGKNPYWDWDGVMITDDEEKQLGEADMNGRRNLLQQARSQQAQRKPQPTPQQGAPPAPASPDDNKELPLTDFQDTAQIYRAYYFNHFDQPRKPYIFATVFNNENSPIGQTDMITQAAPLQENVDRRKRQIDENADLVNGQIKVDSTVMEKSDAQKLRYETGGIIYGKGAVAGVARETGNSLPAFVYEDMKDSRAEIDNIMAASSAFRGEREGTETKAGRLALIDQSYLALNELVQVVDYVNYELFNWFYQLARVKYTVHHTAKSMGKDVAMQITTLIQYDFEDGAEIRVISGKTLPEDRQFKYEQAQKDVHEGLLSPVDYFDVAGYESPNEKAKNRVVYDLNRPLAVGISPQELQQIAPPTPQNKPPSTTINFRDLPPDGQLQLAKEAGLQLDPQVTIAEHQHEVNQQQRPTSPTQPSQL